MKRIIIMFSILTIAVSLFSWQLDRQAQFPVNMFSMDRFGNNVVLGGGSGGVGFSTDNGENFNFVMTPTYNVGTGVYNDANDVAFADQNHVALASEDGMILLSSNGGASWTQAPQVAALFGTDDANGIAYHADGKIWTVGTSGKVAYSADHGQTWVLQTTPNNDTYYRISMNTAGTGYIACNKGTPGVAKLLKTTNFGTTWTALPIGTPGELTNFAVEQYGNLVVVACDSGTISYSPDNGTTWNHHETLVNSRLNGIAMNGSEGYAVGWGGLVVKTTNSWQTVQVVENDWAYNSQDVIYDANGQVMLAGFYGTVAKSTDGATWVEKTVSSVDNYSISLIDQNNWYLVGDKGTIFKTTNAGTTYDKIFVQPLEDNAVGLLQTSHFFNANVGMVTGKTTGVIYRTINGGNTWTGYQIPGVASSKTMYTFEFLDEMTGWVFGFASVAAKTTNAGVTWTPITLTGINANDNIYSAYAFDQNNIFLGGKNGVLYKTSNGTAFSSLNVGSSNINDIHFTDANHGVLVNTNGDIYYTTNGGATAADWSLATESANANLFTIYEADNGTLVAGGYSSDPSNLGTTWALMKSEDNGATWAQISLPETTFNPVRIMDIAGWGNNVIAVGKNQVVYSGSVEGGVTPPPPTGAVDLFFSEYIEGSSFNKAIEIFNGTGAAIDLSQYTIKYGLNGGAYSETTVYSLSDVMATLADGDVLVLAHADAHADILAVADATPTLINHNGDDTYGLFKNGVLIDVIGIAGQGDPGDGWEVAGVTNGTKDHTLVRKPDVDQGVIDWTISAGTNEANSQWIVYANNDTAHIGFHDFNGGSSNNVAMPTFNPAPGSYIEPVSVVISSATPNASIYYTLDGTDPSASSTMYSAPINVATTTTIKAIAYAADLDPSFVVTANYTILTVQNVATISALKLGSTDGTVYNLTGEAIASFTQTYRNQRYVQDAGAGILVDDINGVITTPITVGDGVTGLKGTLSEFGGMIQFTPVQNITSISSTNNVITPVVATVAQLTANFNTYAARLVALENTHFNVTGSFANGEIYEMTQGTANYNFRSTFYDVDYIGTAIPEGVGTVLGIPNSRAEGQFFTARSVADFTFGPVINPAPRNLAAQVTENSVALTWQAPAGADNVTGYKIYKNTAYLAQVGVAVLTYTDNGLADGDYSYYVTAMYGTDESSASNAVTVHIGGSQGVAEDLFISEYLEGTGNNKALEIFNGTGAAVDLTPYVLKSASNGNEWNNELDLEGTLADGAVFVVANASANAAILAVSNATSTVTYFNGNDAIGLFLNGVMIDAIGVYQTDPGLGWEVAGVADATLNHTLVRKPTVTVGMTDWAVSAGSNADDSEWLVYDVDDFSYIGSHEFTGGAPVNNVATPVFSPASGTYNEPITVTMTSTTAGASIYYTLDGTEPTASSTPYTTALNIASTTTVKARAYAAGMDPSYIATANYTIVAVVNVTSVAALRSGATDGTIYNLNTEVIVTFAQEFRNQKYIQDNTAGILIDDMNNVLNRAYNTGDAVTGLRGTVSIFGNMTQFIPTQVGPVATSTGNIVTPVQVSISQLMSNFDTYESRVVKVSNVMFVAPSAFANGMVYSISDGTSNFSFRTTFYDVDYIGTNIPLETGHIMAIPNARAEGNYITARNSADLLFTGINPPDNLTAQVIDGGVMLNWDNEVDGAFKKTFVNENGETVVVTGETRVEQLRDPDSWKVYRNTTMLAEVEVEEYLDPITADGVYMYYVTAMYGDVESGPSNTVSVTIGDPGAIIIQDNFETYPDFALEFGHWNLLDVDQAETYSIEEVDFLNAGSPMSYIVFNPAMTTPPIEEEAFTAYNGNKYLASFASIDVANNDWMITRPFTLDEEGTLSFTAKSVTDQYGLERFNVLVSTSSINLEDFNVISGDTYVSAPASWTDYSYSLNAYAGQTIRVAIQCVSNDAFMFMLDNFKVTAPGGTGNGNDVTNIVTGLTGNYPNPFNPETTISYNLRDAGQVTLDIYNLKGQLVKTLVNERQTAGAHSIVWNGKDEGNRSVSSGVYFYKMRNGKFSSTKKMILMK
ncbi:MAG: chitobiase/beta-hexosaminidase C-terminal domain-containing protein [Candidatus Cloacimonadales bacterium]